MLDCRTHAELRKLIRNNSQQVEVAARALRIDGPVRELHLTGSAGHRAVFFVGRNGREHNVGKLRSVSKEEVVNDEQFESAWAIRRFLRKRLEWIRANDV